MATITVTEAEKGTVIASNGLLSSIVINSMPTSYSDDYFCLTREDRVLYNLHMSTSYVTVGSWIMFNETIPFKDLNLHDIPPGCSFNIDVILPATLDSLSPDTAVSGDPDFTLSCIGTEFNEHVVINFAGHDEPTTLVSPTEVTTIVKPSLFAPATVPVYLHEGDYNTDAIDFTFTEPAPEE